MSEDLKRYESLVQALDKLDEGLSDAILKKDTGTIVRGWKLKDALWIFFSVLTGIFIAMILPFSNTIVGWIGKIGVGLVIIFSLGILILEVGRGGLRLYQLLIYALIHLMATKKYQQNKKNDVSFFNPYEKVVVEENLNLSLLKFKTGNKKNKSSTFDYYMSGVEVIGKNIFNNDSTSIVETIDRFRKTFLNCDLQISLVKLERPVQNIDQIAFLNDLLDKNIKLYQKNKLTENQFNARKTQIKGYINGYYSSNSGTNIDHQIKRYYFLVYGEKPSTIGEAIDQIIANLSFCGLSSFKLTKYELLNLSRNIYFPEEKDLSISEIEDNIDDIEKLFPISKITFGRVDFKVQSKQKTTWMNVSAISEHPLRASVGWMVNLFNVPCPIIVNIKNITIVGTGFLIAQDEILKDI